VPGYAHVVPALVDQGQDVGQEAPDVGAHNLHGQAAGMLVLTPGSSAPHRRPLQAAPRWSHPVHASWFEQAAAIETTTLLRGMLAHWTWRWRAGAWLRGQLLSNACTRLKAQPLTRVRTVSWSRMNSRRESSPDPRSTANSTGSTLGR
jgi:hypothetical protein